MMLIEPATATLQPGENTIDLTVYGPFVVLYFGREDYIDVTIRLVLNDVEYDRCVLRLIPYTFLPPAGPICSPQTVPMETRICHMVAQCETPISISECCCSFHKTSLTYAPPPPPKLPSTPVSCPPGTVLTLDYLCTFTGDTCVQKHPERLCCCKHMPPPRSPPLSCPSNTILAPREICSYVVKGLCVRTSPDGAKCCCQPPQSQLTPSLSKPPQICPQGTVLTSWPACALEGGICEQFYPDGNCCCRPVPKGNT